MRRRKCSAVEIEREDEFDLPEIAQMIRVDIQELGLRSSVTVKRHKRKNSEIIIADIPAGLRDTVYCLAKNYVRSTWNDYHQHFGINFIPVVRLAYDGELTMCNFLSAIVLRSGEILCDPEHTDSHEDLVAAHNLRDNGHGGFVRIEFIPVNEQFTDVSSYKLVLDEPDRPEWFDDALEERILESLRDRVRRMIVDDERTMLLGGCWILGPNAIVKMVLSARIYCMLGSAKIGNVGGSAKIGNVRDNAQIGEKGPNATVLKDKAQGVLL